MATPCRDDYKRVAQRCRVEWRRYLQNAMSLDELPTFALMPSFLLHKVPSFPSRDQLIPKTVNGNYLEICGQGTWSVRKPENCDLGVEKVIRRQLIVGVPKPTPCTVQASEERNPSTTEPPQRPDNYTAVLTLAWAYLFCMYHVENDPDAAMEYSDSMAQTIDSNKLQHVGFYVDLGDVKSAEERWWRAVLAPGQGWHAIIQRPQFYSPWSVSYTGEYTFLVASSAPNSLRCGLRPPSFQHGYNYLLKFCRRHNVGGQAYVALAATLILPLLNLLRRQARLPAPTSASFCKSTATVLLKDSEAANIQFYLTLSCDPSIVASVLWGIFWEPGLDCNLVSPALNPAIEVLQMLLQDGQDEVLVKVLAQRRPKIGSLWLGAVATGFSHPDVILGHLRRLDARYSRPDAIAAAWTGSPQSFIDEAGSGPYLRPEDHIAGVTDGAGKAAEMGLSPIRGMTISRADRWRLLHDVGEPPYNNTPLGAWQPFGRISRTSCEVSVRKHETCTRHIKTYSHWTWVTSNGLSPPDSGCSFAPQEPLDLSTSEVGLSTLARHVSSHSDAEEHEASAAATRGIFEWNTVGGEGCPQEDRVIFAHPWLRDSDSEHSSGSDGMSNGSTEDLQMSYDIGGENERHFATISDDTIPDQDRAEQAIESAQDHHTMNWLASIMY